MLNNTIDFVIPWVDGSDPLWIKEKSKYRSLKRIDDAPNRYRDWGTLKYWFRGVEKFAPWVNQIHFVTYGHLPPWLRKDNPKLKIVNHRDYIPEEYLPTFSSHPIELNFHRIPNLSEKFVYFNDDMFLLRPIPENFFFHNDLPCDCAILSPIIMEKETDMGFVCARNMSIINRHFNKSEVLSEKKSNWFSVHYGKELLRTICLLPWHHLPGFYNIHMPQAFLKSTFEEVWKMEPNILTEVSAHRFRDYEDDVNQWLFRYWQICSNRFSPVSASRGRCFEDVCEEALRTIRMQSSYMICLNDSHEIEFERHREQLLCVFKEILPEKSSFEI